MSRAVMLSINPKWCAPIASGKKTVEVRKTKPKLNTPFKCYIYCTKKSYKEKYLHTSNMHNHLLFWHNPNDTTIAVMPEDYQYIAYVCNGKVIGEFVCDYIYENISYDSENTCVSANELSKYANGKALYGWHISDLMIYDKPKELGEFFYACKKSKGTDCSVCIDNRENICKSLERPPQSWCYVEEVSI